MRERNFIALGHERREFFPPTGRISQRSIHQQDIVRSFVEGVEVYFCSMYLRARHEGAQRTRFAGARVVAGEYPQNADPAPAGRTTPARADVVLARVGSSSACG